MNATSEEVARRFVDALHAIEREGEAQVGPMVALFAEKAAISNSALKQAGTVREGPDGARRFWSDYAATFHGARTEFHQVTLADQAVGLFWTTHGGQAEAGTSIDYDGATLLELDGDDARIARLNGYYDTRAIAG